MFFTYSVSGRSAVVRELILFSAIFSLTLNNSEQIYKQLARQRLGYILTEDDLFLLLYIRTKLFLVLCWRFNRTEQAYERCRKFIAYPTHCKQPWARC